MGKRIGLVFSAVTESILASWQLVQLSSLAAASQVSGNEPKRVLILVSFGCDFAPSNALTPLFLKLDPGETDTNARGANQPDSQTSGNSGHE